MSAFRHDRQTSAFQSSTADVQNHLIELHTSGCGLGSSQIVHIRVSYHRVDKIKRYPLLHVSHSRSGLLTRRHTPTISFSTLIGTVPKPFENIASTDSLRPRLYRTVQRFRLFSQWLILACVIYL